MLKIPPECSGSSKSSRPFCYHRDFPLPVTPPAAHPRGRLIAAAACAAFLVAGQFFLPRLGIEDDEALFAMPILQPKYWEFAIPVGKRQLALMLMTYLGTLKTLLYKPLLHWFGAGVWSVREPALAAGAASIWLFYLLLRRTVGERAAVVGCCLLAADALYLLTSVFDWGPVALQHLLLTGGMLLAVRFYQQRERWALAAAFFLFGLAIWDKALAAWMLAGMGVAAGAVFRRELRSLIRPGAAAIAFFAFVLGALPLLVYNCATGWATFQSNVQGDGGEVAGKLEILRQTVDGRGLIGLFTEEDRPAPAPHRPSGAVQHAAFAVAQATGHPVANFTRYGLLLALLLTPFARGRDLRATLFAWLALIVAWAQMAFNHHTGGSVHHTILLWPLPYLAMAPPLAAASRRIGRAGLPALAVMVALLAGSNALVADEYYVRMLRQGGSIPWTDAIFKLNAWLKGSTVPIYCVDWGILDNLRLMSRGRLYVRDAAEHTSRPAPTAEDREIVRAQLSIPDAVFVVHTNLAEIFPGNTERLMQAAAAGGFHAQLLATIPDSFGRPIFQVYRFAQP